VIADEKLTAFLELERISRDDVDRHPYCRLVAGLLEDRLNRRSVFSGTPLRRFRRTRCTMKIPHRGGAGKGRRRTSRTQKGRSVERIWESLADCSSLPKHEESLFLQQNDYWIIRYHGYAASLKSTRGLHYLAVLLRDPGREFHVRELVVLPMDASTPAAAVAANERVTVGLYVGVPVLDARAKAEYGRRINELRQELNQAERFNDLQRKTEVQNQLQAIAGHLDSAVGLGGRDRRTSSDAERARSAVTKCIKKALQKITETLPSLGYHLAARIKTGYFCSYKPHPDRPVAWKFLFFLLADAGGVISQAAFRIVEIV
jgi:hypothetical protein